MFIQTEETPNPNALKFYPGQVINENEPVHYFQDSDLSNSTLAQKLISIPDICGVFFGYDFITITKDDKKDWTVLKPEILVTIMDHLVAGIPIFDSVSNEEYKISYEDLGEIEKQIVEIINTRIRPAVAQDGGDIVYQGFDDGIVKLKLKGSCSGCPSSQITLKNGIESMLKYYIPEVKEVEAVNL